MENCRRYFASALLAGFFLSSGLQAQQTHTTWRDYGGASDSMQYSALTQINRSNVKNLRVAWTYPIADGKKYAFNPIVVDNLMYVMAKNNSIIALEATTGKEVWVHPTDPKTTLLTERGINYWQSKDGSDRRLILAVNNLLQEIDAKTGKSITSFGNNGTVNLKEGLGRDPNAISLVQSLTPGKVFENLIILGSATNQEYDSAPGDIRAYNVLTGKLAWTFHTIPHEGEYGYDTWPKDAWKTVGGANAWGELTVDEKRGIVYIPTGSPKYNFYGANRKGQNLFGDCLLALDARTGKRLWHFQMVHHDIWDYDNTTSPKLLTVKHNGKMVDAVALSGKEGFVWLFDRVTGESLFPIEERPVPRSDMPGEEAWPTQPFPLKPPPFARQTFTVNDINPYIKDPQERARFRDEILSARNEGMFTPPGLRNTIEMPGNNGGGNWGSAAADPTTATFYVVSKDYPAMLKLEADGTRAAALTGPPEFQGQFVYLQNCKVCHGVDRKGSPPAVPSLVDIAAIGNSEHITNIVRHGQGPMPAFGKLSNAEVRALIAYLYNPSRAPANVPLTPPTPEEAASGKAHYRSGFGFMVTSDGLSAIKPPWTSITAYDMNEGTIKWKKSLGEVPELAAQGIKDTGAHFPKVGPVVTAGGLIFTGTRDKKVRALDSATGDVIWEMEVDAALEGMPAVYEVGGKEYLVFCAAAQATTHIHGSPGHPPASGKIQGAYVAFALPN